MIFQLKVWFILLSATVYYANASHPCLSLPDKEWKKKDCALRFMGVKCANFAFPKCEQDSEYYPDGVDCKFITFEKDVLYSLIELTWVRFDLEEKKNGKCNDYVEILDMDRSSNQVLIPKDGGIKYCGSKKPWEGSRTFNLTTLVLNIHMDDKITKNTGFKLLYCRKYKKYPLDDFPGGLDPAQSAAIASGVLAGLCLLSLLGGSLAAFFSYTPTVSAFFVRLTPRIRLANIMRPRTVLWRGRQVGLGTREVAVRRRYPMFDATRRGNTVPGLGSY